MRRLLAASRADRERDFLAILVAYSHGLRASELIELTPDKLRDGFLDVQRLKGSKRTIQPLLTDADPLFNEREAVFAFIRGMHEKQRLFPFCRQTFWRIMQRHAEAAGLPAHKRHPHILKHSIAAQIIGPAGIEHTRQWLGHVDMSSTGAYVEVSDEQAAEAVKRALKG